ncbi:MAG: hypothetical protein KAR38_12875 [Calditrichia bacterium]|nr:hypothetical protein [Calditrichia bacterium]
MFKNIFDLSSHMLISFGIMLVLIAFLLIVLPELLAWFIASLIMGGGVYLITLGIKSKKIAKEQDNQFTIYM